jgi:hypothetical protein
MLEDVHVGDWVTFHHGGWPGRDDLAEVVAEAAETVTIAGGREFLRSNSYAVDGAQVYITAVKEK